MFRNKLFLFGFGAGLIAGAVLLQLILYAEPVNEADLMKQADKIGYVLVKKEDTQDDRISVDFSSPVTSPSPAVQSTSAPSVEPTPTAATEAPTPLVTETPIPAATPLPAASSTPSPPPSASPTSITIPPGTGAGAAGKLLVLNKIIVSQEEFDNELARQKLTDRVQSGTFTFSGNESLNEVIKIITRTL